MENSLSSKKNSAIAGVASLLSSKTTDRKKKGKKRTASKSQDLLSPSSSHVDKSNRQLASPKRVSHCCPPGILAQAPSIISIPTITSLTTDEIAPPSPDKVSSFQSTPIFQKEPKRSETAIIRKVPVFSYDHTEMILLKFNEFVQYLQNYP